MTRHTREHNGESIDRDGRIMAIDDYKKNIQANKDAPDSWCVLSDLVSVKGNEHLEYAACNHESRGMLQDPMEKIYTSKATWQEAVNSDRMKSVRKDMLEGKCTRLV